MQVAAVLTADSASSRGDVPGVINSQTGTIEFKLLSSSQRDGAGGVKYFVIDSVAEQCRGEIDEVCTLFRQVIVCVHRAHTHGGAECKPALVCR